VYKRQSLVSGDQIYSSRGDLWAKKFWHCESCKAWVGCHDGTDVPLGRLANAALRHAKMEAHAVFDPLWRAKIAKTGMPKGRARAKAYAWLSRQLGTPPEKTHIGMFDEATCRRVKDVCWPHFERLRSGRSAR
jgi:hypothetical protein